MLETNGGQHPTRVTTNCCQLQLLLAQLAVQLAVSTVSLGHWGECWCLYHQHWSFAPGRSMVSILASVDIATAQYCT